MILPIHVIIALSSMLIVGYTFFFPSKKLLKMSYGLVALTLVSGTYLVWSTHSPMLQACTSGLIYIGAVSMAITATNHKMAKASK